MSVALRLAVGVALAGVACGEAPRPAPPNVVFILADDIGYGDLPPYRRAAGLSEPYALPHIERLAREGMLFLDAHQPAAICAPARFAMLTGSNPSRGRPAWGMNVPSTFDVPRPDRHRSVGLVMQAAGYRTAFIGKEHTGGPGLDAQGQPTLDLSRLDVGRSVETEIVRGDGTRLRRRVSRPRGLIAHGFDTTWSLASGIQGPPYVFWRDDLFAPIDPASPADASALYSYFPYSTREGPNGTSRVLVPGIGDRDWDSSQVGIRLADAAVRFIESQQRSRAGPFLLFYSSQAIHVPHTPPIDFDGDPDPLDVPVRGAALSHKTDMVVEFDLQVGRILDALDAAGIADQTLVFLTSDNGGHLGAPDDVQGKKAEREAGYDSSGALRGGKDTPWEGGHRVPFLARWGDGTRAGSHIAPGTATRQLVSAADWVASLYDLTGQALPPDQAMDSVSLLPLLRSAAPDREPPVRDRLLFRGYDTQHAQGFGVRYDERNAGGVLVHQWYYFEHAPDERLGGQLSLFDLRLDPGQHNDLLRGIRVDSDPKQLGPRAMRRRYLYWDRVTRLRDWAHGHMGPGDPASTPRVDYRDPELRTPLRLSPATSRTG
jgi:arylsulfatase A-like enzyme